MSNEKRSVYIVGTKNDLSTLYHEWTENSMYKVQKLHEFYDVMALTIHELTSEEYHKMFAQLTATYVTVICHASPSPEQPNLFIIQVKERKV